MLDAPAGVLAESKLQPLLASITELTTDNDCKAAQISKLQQDLQSADVETWGFVDNCVYVIALLAIACDSSLGPSLFLDLQLNVSSWK